MHRAFRGRLLAAAVIFSTVPFAFTAPVAAQVSVDISFDTFHDQLSRYGDWVYSDRWGMVWQPGDVPDDFRPYDTAGHWEYTDEYGWMWVSDYDWGDIAFHYGRWVYDPDDGWLWMPGYVWSPAWVVWRGNNDYLGWMPMPPDDNFLYGRPDIGISVSWSDPDRYYTNWYGSSWRGAGSMWVFVNYGHIADRDYHRYEAPRGQTINLVRQTTNITNYTVVNNYVVNRSIDVRRVAQAAHRPIQPVRASTVIRNPNMIATVAHGEQVRARMINFAPRGLGKPGSAPPPPPAIINRLSDHAVSRGQDRHGGPPQHLFTKSALTQPGAANRFHGKPLPQAPGAMQTAPMGMPAGATGGPTNLDRQHRPGGANNSDSGAPSQNIMGGRGEHKLPASGNAMRGDSQQSTGVPSNTNQYNHVGNSEHGPINGTIMPPGSQSGPGDHRGAGNTRSERGPNTGRTGPDSGPNNAAGGPLPGMERGNHNTMGPDNGPPPERRMRGGSGGPSNNGPGPDNGAHGPQNMMGPSGEGAPPERAHGHGPVGGPPPEVIHERGPGPASVPPPEDKPKGERHNRQDQGDQPKPHKGDGPPPQ